MRRHLRRPTLAFPCAQRLFEGRTGRQVEAAAAWRGDRCVDGALRQDVAEAVAYEMDLQAVAQVDAAFVTCAIVVNAARQRRPGALAAFTTGNTTMQCGIPDPRRQKGT